MPGCEGAGSPGTDYCYRHYTGWGIFSIEGDNGIPAENFPLGVCEGDCDYDSHYVFVVCIATNETPIRPSFLDARLQPKIIASILKQFSAFRSRETMEVQLKLSR